MMKKKKIKHAIRELKDSLAYFGLFSSLFDSLILFALVILVLYLLNLPWVLAFLAVIPYLFIHTKSNIRKLNLKFVEAKVPELEEALRTCADTKDIEDNEVVAQLHEEVIDKMKKIKTSYFLSLSKLSRQIIFLAILSFLIIVVSAYHVRFIDVPQTIDDLKNLGSSKHESYMIDESLLGYEEMDEDADIFGNKSVAELGSKELTLEINPLLSDVDISKIDDPRDVEFYEVIPTEIDAVTDASYEESIPKHYQRIVKTYFKEISKT